MSDIVPVPTAWIKGAAMLATIAAAGIFLLGRCSVSPTQPLPPTIQHALDRHVAASVADTQTVHRLERVAATAKKKASADSAARVTAEAAARISNDRADSLAAAASVAATARDSADAYRAAYVARTHEADSLAWSVHLAGEQLREKAVQQAAADSSADVWKRHALRGDSVIAQLLPLAEHRDQCKIAWVITCPTRRQALVGGAVVGAGVALIATGRIKIPIALRF